MHDLKLRITKYLAREEYENCGNHLHMLNTQVFDEVLLVDLVRVTYPHWTAIPGWLEFLDKVGNELHCRGLDSVTLLDGLDPSDQP